MEADNSPSQGPAHRQPQPGAASRPMAPAGRRPMIDGFSPRRADMPAASLSRPARPSTPIPVSGPSQTPSQPQPVFRRPVSTEPQAATRPTATTHASHAVTQSPFPVNAPDTMPSSKAKPPKEHNQTGHAGLAGFVAFVLLGALLLLPVLPGKIMQNFPLSSQTFSTGDQALDCIGSQGTISTSTKYNSKAGSPLNYTYSTTSKQSATCNGTTQSATTGHASQFSPLALVIDLALAFVLSIVVAKVWRLIFGEKRHNR